MPAGMEIDILAGGLDDAIRKLDLIADRLERIDQINGRIGASSRNSTAGGGSRGGGSRAAEDRFLSGPNQRLLEIEAQRKKAEALTDSIRREAILKDLAQAEFRAKRANILNQRRLDQGDEALNRKGLLELFGDLNGLLGSLQRGDIFGAARAVSRVQFLNTQEGAGGLNVEQKLGRTQIGGRLPVAQVVSTASTAASAAEAEAGAAGAAGGAAAGSLALPVAGLVVGLILATKAAQIFAQETQASAARLHQHGADAFLSGGYQAAQLRALGVDPSGVGGLRDRLATDGMAQFTAARYGIGYTLPSQYSADQNDAKLELAVLQAIRQANREGGMDEARRVARIFGREGDLDKALVSDRVFNLAGRVGRNGEVIDRRYSQTGRDFDRQMELLGQQGDQFKDIALAPLLHQLEMGFGGVNTILERMIGAGSKLSDVWDGIVATFMRTNSFFGPELSALQALGGMGGGHQTAQQALAQSNYDLLEGVQKLADMFRKSYGAGPFGDAGRPRVGRDDPASWKSYQENSPYLEWPG